MSKTINIASRGMGDPQMMAWVRANDLDPNDILLDSEAVIDGDELTLTVFVLNEDRARVGYVDADGNAAYRKGRLTVALLAQPEDFGITPTTQGA